ncbi:hypothetical protein V9T40_010718 [Parthenolecanium corni]|uniref:Uncharacterized protein n=1 Tax=Parthenolecanium corni TaxID=536013 RepID=A0AAN9T424_9HEMI
MVFPEEPTIQISNRSVESEISALAGFCNTENEILLKCRNNAEISDCKDRAEMSLGGFQLSQFSSICLNFRLDVSFFVQLSQFSAGCPIFRPAVSIFGWMSHFSSSCLNFRLDVSFFVQLSQF